MNCVAVDGYEVLVAAPMSFASMGKSSFLTLTLIAVPMPSTAGDSARPPTQRLTLRQKLPETGAFCISVMSEAARSSHSKQIDGTKKWGYIPPLHIDGGFNPY